MQAQYLRKLSTLLEGGVPIIQALHHLETKSSGLSVDVSRKLRMGIEAGKSFVGAAAEVDDFLKNHQLDFVAAGEVSGRMAESLKMIAEAEERQNKLRKTLMSGFLYPAVLYHLGVFVPSIITFATKGLFWALLECILLLFPAYLLIVVAVMVLRGRDSGIIPSSSIDRLLIKIPWIGSFLRYLAVYRFFISMRQMLLAGMRLDECWEKASVATGSDFFKEDLETGHLLLTKGQPLSQAFQSASLFHSEEVEMVETAEASGKLEFIFQHLADQSLDEAHSVSQNMAKRLPMYVYYLVGLFMVFRIYLVVKSIFDQIGSVTEGIL
ncbi:MAG: type II secretion system F family protein [Verrucomicrobiota bacterium]